MSDELAAGSPEVTLESLHEALRAEKKKAIQLRDEGNIEEAKAAMHVISKLQKSIDQLEIKELKAKIKAETHEAIAKRDTGDLEAAKVHMKNIKLLQKELATREGEPEAAEGGETAAASGTGTADEVHLAGLQSELKAVMKAAMEAETAGDTATHEAKMTRMREVQAEIKVVKARVKEAEAAHAAAAAAAAATAAAEAAAAEAAARQAGELDAAQAAQLVAEAQAAMAAAAGAADDDPFKITPDMSKEQQMMIRQARKAAEEKAAREAEMKAMMGARKKTVFAEASSVQRVDTNEPGWVKQQKRAFKAWVNYKLAERGLHLDDEQDITQAFKDGLSLIALAEVLCEDRVAKHVARPKFRVQFIENGRLALQLLAQHGFTADASAENFADCTSNMILGFIFLLFVKFVGGDQKDGGMDGLLRWVQGQVNGGAYAGVDVQDFSGSFQSGLAVAALLHSLKPDYVSFDDARAGAPRAAHVLGFEAAKAKLSVPMLLDADEMLAAAPDEKAVRMYVMLIKVAHERKQAAAAARAAHLATLRERLERMDTDALWRLYDGLIYEGDCPVCDGDLRQFFATLFPCLATA